VWAGVALCFDWGWVLCVGGLAAVGFATATTDRRSTQMHRNEIAGQIITQRRARQERLRSLWELTASERVAAMRRGELTLEQCAAWAARYPEQVPLLNGEFEYLTAFTPEALE
jgi:hypothetical protein